MSLTVPASRSHTEGSTTALTDPKLASAMNAICTSLSNADAMLQEETSKTAALVKKVYTQQEEHLAELLIHCEQAQRELRSRERSFKEVEILHEKTIRNLHIRISNMHLQLDTIARNYPASKEPLSSCLEEERQMILLGQSCTRDPKTLQTEMAEMQRKLQVLSIVIERVRNNLTSINQTFHEKVSENVAIEAKKEIARGRHEAANLRIEAANARINAANARIEAANVAVPAAQARRNAAIQRYNSAVRRIKAAQLQHKK